MNVMVEPSTEAGAIEAAVSSLRIVPLPWASAIIAPGDVGQVDPEIEPAAGQEIEGRRLLGEQYRVVPWQDDYCRAEPQRRRARAEPGQQVDRRGHLAVAGEMVLDDKGAVKTERLGLDIVIDEVAEPLRAVELALARTGAPRRSAAEQTEPHMPCSVSAAARVGARPRCSKCRFFIAAIALRYHRSGGAPPRCGLAPPPLGLAGDRKIAVAFDAAEHVADRAGHRIARKRGVAAGPHTQRQGPENTGLGDAVRLDQPPRAFPRHRGMRQDRRRRHPAAPSAGSSRDR